MTANPITQVNAAGFEVETCSRCWGEGHYSRNSYGSTVCYQCRGAKVCLTKRGAAARAKMIELQTHPVAELQAGMFVWDDTYGKKARLLKVISVKQTSEKDNGSYALVNGQKVYFFYIETERGIIGVYPDSHVRFVKDEQERQATLAVAVAYQAGLNKRGK